MFHCLLDTSVSDEVRNNSNHCSPIIPIVFISVCFQDVFIIVCLWYTQMWGFLVFLLGILWSSLICKCISFITWEKISLTISLNNCFMLHIFSHLFWASNYKCIIPFDVFFINLCLFIFEIHVFLFLQIGSFLLFTFMLTHS